MYNNNDYQTSQQLIRHRVVLGVMPFGKAQGGSAASFIGAILLFSPKQEGVPFCLIVRFIFSGSQSELAKGTTSYCFGELY